MAALIQSFPGSTASRATLIGAAQNLKDHPPLPFGDIVSDQADCFLSRLDQYQGDDLGEIRVAVNQRIADNLRAAAEARKTDRSSLVECLGGMGLAAGTVALLSTHPAIAVGTAAVAVGLWAHALLRSSRAESQVVASVNAVADANRFGKRLEDFGAYIAAQTPAPAPQPPAPAPEPPAPAPQPAPTGAR